MCHASKHKTRCLTWESNPGTQELENLFTPRPAMQHIFKLFTVFSVILGYYRQTKLWATLFNKFPLNN